MSLPTFRVCNKCENYTETVSVLLLGLLLLSQLLHNSRNGCDHIDITDY